jgi:hypothetical protein
MEPSLVAEVSRLHCNASNVSLARSYGLEIQTVAWEDTARSKNSCWGPNISDLTLNVNDHALPMIRKPNFADVTADVPMTAFSVTAGNETPSGDLKRVSFRDYVAQTLGLPGLILDRDDVLLTSAQACVLPCGESGETEFYPQLFSYQSRPDDPAVLVVVASSQGTSAHVITGVAEKLLFNRGGQAAMFLAKRLSQDRRERGVPEEGEMTSDELDRNALLLFQIPLKQKPPPPPPKYYGTYYKKELGLESCMVGCGPSDGWGAPSAALSSCNEKRGGNPPKGLEYATLRASDKIYGAFKGTRGFELTRDERFPIRVTFQMYTVTDDPVLKESQVQDLAERIGKVYASGRETGSLVTNTTARATEPRPLASVMGAEGMPLFRMGV